MQIGLMRHFKVVAPQAKTFMSAPEFKEWVERYNNAEVECTQWNANDDIEWNLCYSSALPRAIKTAQHIYTNEIYIRDQLNEIHIAPIVEARLKLTLSLWLIAGRIGWLMNLSSQERKMDTLFRAAVIIDEIESLTDNSTNVLIVTHGALMTVLSRELRKRGYTGRVINRPRNGTIYTFSSRLD